MKKIQTALICILLFPITVVFARDKGMVKNGALDLRNWNWQKNGIVNLTGDWEFYWQKFYDPSLFADSFFQKKEYAFVPSFWNTYTPEKKILEPDFGYATYHLLVLCPESNEQLALKFLTVESAYNLFVNGRKILQVGQPDSTEEATIAELKPVIVDVTPQNNQLDIVIQVANFHNYRGGLWDFVKLGTSDDLHEETIKNISIELFIAGAFFVAAVYYLVLFLNFRVRKALLFFSMLCFIVCVRNLAIEEMPLLYFHFDWEFVRRAEYISFYLSVPMMSLFSYYLFPDEFSKTVLKIVLLICTPFVAVSLFTSYYIYTFPVRYYQALMLLATFYGLYVYTIAAVKKRHGSILFLAGFCVFLITIINDVLYVNYIIDTTYLFYVGLAFFGVTLFILLSQQFVHMFYELQKLNSEILSGNKELARMNNEISKKNEELNKINYELDSFVNRTSHDLKAPLNSVLGIITTAKKEINVNLLHEYLSLQEKTLRRMNNLIQDIIDFSKNKRLRLDLKEIDFKEIVIHGLEDHAYMSNAPKVKKNIEINHYEKFVSDARRISVIINNLVSNAIKYADVAKAQPEMGIKITVADSAATIEVTDNGIGIEEKNLDNIFTLFYSFTNSVSGSGLGLYIVKETTEKLNGYITVNSKKGQGTTIKIVLPDMGHNLY
jgi:signal transduction histidine kinase